ncbi:hypothetical protein Bbelb_282790 [Branchiostoma belcheri]|nr:hypothetical protein Bbelb_282790 [Branchiostoma belcheri]
MAARNGDRVEDVENKAPLLWKKWRLIKAHGLGHSARAPNHARGLSAVWDTRGLSQTVPGRAQFRTDEGRVPFRALGAELRVLREEPTHCARAQFGTLGACPKPCLGTEQFWTRGGHCPKPCLVPPITMIDSTSGHGLGQSGCVPFCARSGTVWDRHEVENVQDVKNEAPPAVEEVENDQDVENEASLEEVENVQDVKNEAPPAVEEVENDQDVENEAPLL